MVELSDIRCYVLNLARRTDRRERISQMLPPELPVTFTSDWPGPFDHKQLSRSVLNDLGVRECPSWRIESDNKHWARPLTLGEVGSALHHLASWRDAWQAGSEPYVIVFEDDAVLPHDFLDQLLAGLRRLEEAGTVFGLLYLGRVYHDTAEDEPVIPGFVRPGLSYGVHGYLLHRAAIPVLLEAGFDRALMPVDEFIPCMYTDHPRDDLRARFPKRLLALAFDPILVDHPPRVDSDIYCAEYIE